MWNRLYLWQHSDASQRYIWIEIKIRTWMNISKLISHSTYAYLGIIQHLNNIVTYQHSTTSAASHFVHFLFDWLDAWYYWMHGMCVWLRANIMVQRIKTSHWGCSAVLREYCGWVGLLGGSERLSTCLNVQHYCIMLRRNIGQSIHSYSDIFSSKLPHAPIDSNHPKPDLLQNFSFRWTSQHTTSSSSPLSRKKNVS